MPGITVDTSMKTDGVIRGAEEIQRAIESLRNTIDKVNSSIASSSNQYVKAFSSASKAASTASDGFESAGESANGMKDEFSAAVRMMSEYINLTKQAASLRDQIAEYDDRGVGEEVSDYRELKEALDATANSIQMLNAESQQLFNVPISQFWQKGPDYAEDVKALQEYQQQLMETNVPSDAWTDWNDQFNSFLGKYQNIKEIMDNIYKQAKTTVQETGPLLDGVPTNQEQEKQLGRIVSADDFEAQAGAIEKSAKNLFGVLGKLDNQMQKALADNDTKAVERLKYEFDNARKEAIGLQSAMQELSTVQIQSDEYAELVSKIAKAKEELRKSTLYYQQEESKQQSLREKAIEKAKTDFSSWASWGGTPFGDSAQYTVDDAIKEAVEDFEDSDGWKNLEMWKESLEQDKKALQELVELKKQLESQEGTFTVGGSTEDYERALHYMNEVLEKKEEIEKPQAVRTWEGMTTMSDILKQKFAEIQQAAQIAGLAIQHPLQALDRILPIVASGIANLAGRVLNLAASFGKMAINSIVSALRRLASSAINAAVGFAKMAASSVVSFVQRLAVSARNAAVNLARMAGSGIINGLKTIGSLALKAGSALLGMGKSARRSNDGLKQSLKMIVRYVFGVRSMFMLVRRLRSAVTEAFKNMAQKVPEVNTSISSLMSSLDQVKNSLATAFQPILTAVTPYLVQLMDMLTGAMTRVGEFFAALTGQNYVYKATKAQIDYAKSLDKTKKKAKETENQLAGFDHLNILKDNKGDGSSSDTDTTTPTSDFEKMPVESWIKDLADRIKALFKRGDFFGIGKLLADTLESLINRIDFKKIGQKIADGLNAVVDVINGFFDNFDFIDLGQKLSEAFMSLVDRVRWYELGKAMTQKIKATINGLWGFVSRLDWDKIGDAIGNFLQGAFDNIPWGTLGTLLGTSITGVFQAILTAAEAFDWDKAGKELDNGFSNLINSINIDTIYAALRTTLIGILDLIGYILTDVETWGKIASDFATFMNNLFQDDELWNKLRLALIGGMATAIASLKIFVSKFQWGANGTKFGEQIAKLVDEFPDDLGQVLSDLLKGALLFMGNVFSNNEIFTNIATKFSTWVNDIFQNTEMWDNLGITIGESLTSIIGMFQTFFDGFEPEKAANSIKSGLNKLNQYLPGIATGFWNMVKTAFSKAGSFVDALLNETIDPEKAGMSGEYLAKVTAFNQQSIGAKIGTRIREAFELIPWEAIASDLWSAAQTAFSETGNFISSLLGVTEEDIASADNNSAIAIANKLGQVISDAVAKIPWGDFGSALSDGVVNLFNAIAAYFKEVREQGKLQEAISSFINNIDWLEIGKSIVIAAWEAFLAVGETLWQVIVDGMKKNREASESYYEQIFTETANSLVGAYYRGVNEKLMDNESTKETFKTAMDGIVQGADLYGGGETEAERFYNGFIGTVLDENGEVKDEFKSLIEAIYGSVDNFQFGAGDIESFFLGFDDAISNVPTGEGSAFYALMNAVYSSIDTESRGKESTKSYFEGAIDGINEKKDEFGDTLHDAVNDPITDVEQNVVEQGSPSERAKRSGEYYMQGFQDGINNETANTKNTMSTAMDGVVNIVDDKWGNAADAQSTNLNEMSNALSSIMGDMTNTSNQETENQAKPVYDKYGEIMLAVEECMRAAWDYMKQYSGNMVTTMQTDMNNIANTASYGMSNLERTISDSFNRIGSMNWAYIGQNICNGIAQGINNGWGWLNNTVWNLANSLFQSAKNALGIASPSKVFRDQVGYMVGAGLAEGLDDSQHEVLGSITDMAKAMVDEMQTTDLTADVGVNDNTMLNSITGALSTFSIKIEDSFIALTERLQAIADKVTFVTPDIAAGTVLPYAIQGDLNVNTDNVAVALEKNNEELINIMIQLVNNQTSAIVAGLERYCTTNVNIDKKSFTDTIIEEINRRTRAMGASPLLI